jgi:hypothetical protein
MKKTKNNSIKFVWTELRAEINRETREYRVTPLNGLYPIKLHNTTGDVKEYFKNDLINGSDRFLAAVWEVGENHYDFELIMKTENPEAIFEYFYPVAKAIINQNISEPTVITFR